MLKRKINAVFGLLVTALILNHAISISAWMLSGGSFPRTGRMMSWALMVMTLAHALISIDLAISAHAETGKRTGNSYSKMNVATIIQRISGVLMVPTAALHVAGTVGVLKTPQFIHAVLPPLFFTIVLTHTAISTSKALITLGIGNAKFIKVVDIAVKVLCGATLIAGITGFYLHSF